MRAIRANNSRQEANESPNEIFLVSEGKEDHLRYVAERVSLVRFERDETTSRYGKAGNGGDDSKDALITLPELGFSNKQLHQCLKRLLERPPLSSMHGGSRFI
jgi:hypothetical protein